MRAEDSGSLVTPTSDLLGVGILGAGPVTQAIHLPTLARLPDQYRVVAVMDVAEDVAADVAARAGATATTSVDEVLAHPDVDVVAICSPHQFHAEQVEAVCAAGKRGILCEKPLATSREEAEKIAGVAGSARVPIVVGAMHAYDPGWLAAADERAAKFGEVHTVRSTIVLPFNAQFEDWATEVHSRAPLPPARTLDANTRATMVRGMVLGLSIHDLPLVRAIAPEAVQVDHVRFIPPFGGVIALSGGGKRCDLVAFMRPVWQPDWSLEAIADQWSMTVRFTPSYVHAGSATAEIRTEDGERRLGPWPSNGYEREWVALHAQVVDGAPPAYDLTDVVADMTFASDIAEAAAELARHEGGA
jgi:myo-inositol 2-dehydrogenase / D-chiro-inositol 1-dehydrogenase